MCKANVLNQLVRSANQMYSLESRLLKKCYIIKTVELKNLLYNYFFMLHGKAWCLKGEITFQNKISQVL